MGLLPRHGYREDRDAGHRPLRPVADRAVGQRADVEPEDRVHLRVFEDARPDHLGGAAVLAVGSAVLGGLEQELDRSRQRCAPRREHLRDAHEDRRVCVVPARVHDVDLPPVVGRPRPGSERDLGQLLHGQGVHVGPQGDDRRGGTAAEDSDDAGVSDAGPHLQAKRPQVRGHDPRRAQLAVAELGVLVDVAPPGDDLRLDLCRERGDVRGHGRAAVRRRGDRRRRAEREKRPQREGQLRGACASFVSFVFVHLSALPSPRAPARRCAGATRTSSAPMSRDLFSA